MHCNVNKKFEAHSVISWLAGRHFRSALYLLWHFSDHYNVLKFINPRYNKISSMSVTDIFMLQKFWKHCVHQYPLQLLLIHHYLKIVVSSLYLDYITQHHYNRCCMIHQLEIVPILNQQFYKALKVCKNFMWSMKYCVLYHYNEDNYTEDFLVQCTCHALIHISGS